MTNDDCLLHIAIVIFLSYIVIVPPCFSFTRQECTKVSKISPLYFLERTWICYDYCHALRDCATLLPLVSSPSPRLCLPQPPTPPSSPTGHRPSSALILAPAQYCPRWPPSSPSHRRHVIIDPPQPGPASSSAVRTLTPPSCRSHRLGGLPPREPLLSPPELGKKEWESVTAADARTLATEVGGKREGESEHGRGGTWLCGSRSRRHALA